jgi:hypothetical protein
MDKKRIAETIENTTKGEVAPTGGDRDSDRYQAKVVGEEAVGATTPTPGQNNVEDIAASAGVEFSDSEPIAVREELEERDRDRWELDPASKNRYTLRG